MSPTPTKLDHVALSVSDADAVASSILAQLPFRVIEESDRFILLGRDPERGKLTLLRADGPRDRGVLRHVGIGIPCATAERTIDLGEGLELYLAPSAPEGEVELSNVGVFTSDPAASARAWLDVGFEPAPKGIDEVVRVRAGHQHIELWEGRPERSEHPLLNHLGLLVDSVDDVLRTAEERGKDIRRLVDAENSRAVFLSGPDGVEVEYIEHKPAFANA